MSQLVFASICRNFWECGLVAIDDITVSLGDCQITAGKPWCLHRLLWLHITTRGRAWYCRHIDHRSVSTLNPVAQTKQIFMHFNIDRSEWADDTAVIY